MKTLPLLLLVSLGLGIGYLLGRQGKDPAREETLSVSKNTRSSHVIRSARNDPFGGPSFSLSSMDDVRELFKKQRSSVARARLTLSVEAMSAAEIPALMEMIQQDARKSPRDYEGRYELMNCLFERWVQVDPVAAVGFVKSCKYRSFQQTMAGSCFSALAQENPQRAIQELEELPKGQMRQRAGATMLAALADHDPALACDLVERESDGGGNASYYSAQIFAKWAKTDPVAAAARFATMPPNRTGEYGAGALAASWAQTDPEAALSWAKTLKGDQKASAATTVYRALALEDPSGAWERLKSEPGYLRGKLISGVLGTVADEDPQKAAEMLKSIGSKSEQRIAAQEFLSQLSWNDSRLAFDIINQLDDPSVRRAQLGNVMFYAAWTSPESLKEQIGKLTEREKIDTAGQLLRGMVSSDPAAAERYFLALPETQRNTQSLDYMMREYASRDAKQAFEFAISLSNPQEQSAAVSGVFTNWSREDPEAAAEGWKRLPEGQSRLEALGQIANSWGRTDPVAAKEWADSLTGNERVRALAAVLPAMAQDNPQAAGNQLSALIAAPPTGMAKDLAGSAGNLAGRWATDDPTGAANWAAALPEGQSRDAGLKAVSQSWSQYDAIATAQWLGTLETGSSRDAAIEPLVNQVRQTDPGTAFSWAASMSDETQRLNQLQQTLQSWRSSDPEAARAALDAADLSTTVREKLEKELE